MSYRHNSVVICGDTGVGKSSLLSGYVNYKIREGFHEAISWIQVADKNRDIVFFWNIVGNSDTPYPNAHYFHLAKGVMVVYDITSQNSFKRVDYWISEIKNFRRNIPIVIVGNKLDRSNKRQVDVQRAVEKANQFNVEYIETSAKTSENVDNAFEKLILQILYNLGVGFSSIETKSVQTKCKSCERIIIKPYPKIDDKTIKFCPECFTALLGLIRKFDREFDNIF